MQKRILLACLLVLPPIASAVVIHPVVTLSGGFAIANVHSSETIMFGSYPNDYIGTKHHDTEADLGIFIGAESEFLPNWSWQLGASYFRNSGFNENGDVYEFADPEYNNLTYQYQIQSQRVSVDTKISRAFCKRWHPYVSASLGEAFNRSYSYTEYPITSADVGMTEPFANHSNRSFTYSVGAGVDVSMTEHLRIGAGYRFADFGKARLGVSSLQTDNNTLRNKHLLTNEMLVQISYVG